MSALTCVRGTFGHFCTFMTPWFAGGLAKQ
jgi:hypothetical protein